MKIDAIQPMGTLPARSHMETANGLETAFLSEMLKYSGPGPIEGEFSGGIGESQFSSMLTDAYAEVLSMKLDLGLNGKITGKS